MSMLASEGQNQEYYNQLNVQQHINQQNIFNPSNVAPSTHAGATWRDILERHRSKHLRITSFNMLPNPCNRIQAQIEIACNDTLYHIQMKLAAYSLSHSRN